IPRIERRRTGIEPARELVAPSTVLKTAGPTRNPDASVVERNRSRGAGSGRIRAASGVFAHARLGCRSHGSGLLRPGQDDHLALVLARPVATALPSRHGLARTASAWCVCAARLPLGGGGRAEDGATEGRDASAHEGLGPRAGRAARSGRDL